MPNNWGRPPQNNQWRDIKGLAFWVIIIGLGLFLLFPNFFQDVYANLTASKGQSDLGEVTLPSSTDSINNYGSSDYYASLYGTLNGSTLNGGSSEVTAGYWIIFVGDGEFKQLSVTYEVYNFLSNLIKNDQKATSGQTIILVSNGQISTNQVSEEIYEIINNIAEINGRSAGAG